MRSPEGLPGTRRALDAFRHIVRALRESSRQSEQTLGLSGAQLLVLRLVAREPGLSLSDLAARTFTHQSSVSVVARRLTEAGLLARDRAPDDARRAVLTLSARGRAVLERAPVLAQERLIEAFGTLPPAQRAGLAEGLEALVAAMGLGDRPAPLFFEEEKDDKDDADG